VTTGRDPSRARVHRPRGAAPVPAEHRPLGLPPGRHVPDRIGRARRRRPAAARPRGRGPAGGRRLGHAVGDRGATPTRPRS
jgi:hypothetical protein